MLIEFAQCNQLIRALHGAAVKNVCHVGAHVGEEAAAYASNQVEQVIWFEANETLLPRLSQNIAQFSGMQQFIAPYALFHENAQLDFHVTNNFQSSSLFEIDKHAQYYPGITVQETKPVQAYRLDSLFELQPPYLPWTDVEFMNIDTQGAELAVLKGMGRYLDQASMKGIYLEVNSESLYKGIPLLPEIDSFLAEHGYCRVRTAWTQQGWGDAFYIKALTS